MFKYKTIALISWILWILVLVFYIYPVLNVGIVQFFENATIFSIIGVCACVMWFIVNFPLTMVTIMWDDD